MAKDNRVHLPSGGAGITSYSDSYKSSFILKPMHVLVICLVVAAIIILLHLYGKAWIGLA